MDEIWILGATGRVGRAVATRLAAQGVTPVLVGRDAERLRKTGADLGLGDVRVVVADTLERITAEIARQRPAVVVNTIGRYAETAVPIARACLPGGHYLDLANDLVSIPRLLSLDAEASAAGSTFVTGTGFGVLATEAVVAKLCEGRPAPREVRVDALPSLAMEAGPLGEALAASIVDGATTGGLCFQDGRLVKTRLAANPLELSLPDGDSVKSAGAPTGELMAAQLASGAPYVTATSAMMPTGRMLRAALPLAGWLLSIPALARFAIHRLAAVQVKAAPAPRQHTWGHAVVSWPDGSRREGWLRAGDASAFTAAVIAETAVRLARGDGRRGAHTPAVALGAELAVAAGGTFLLD
ncbi:hypothetical protein AB0L70_39145 [Kribbella sp. NPDC051952]|uniref:hypothetical protein n=1 Tax=Kribbella sp. NPDC051952 TaxID=3154851 RepID=UPI0034237C02